LKDDELAPFPELANEKTLKKFLSACLEGGEHRERSLGYFKVAKLDWKKAEKFELVFNPECIPAPEPSKEERQKWDDHCTSPMSGSSLAYKTSGEPPLPPEGDYPGEEYSGDENGWPTGTRSISGLRIGFPSKRRFLSRNSYSIDRTGPTQKPLTVHHKLPLA
jgi:hypothetical protein